MKKYTLTLLLSLLVAGCGSETKDKQSVVFFDIDCPAAVGLISEVGPKENIFDTRVAFEEYYYQLTGRSIDGLDSRLFEEHEVIAVERGVTSSPSHRLVITGYYDEGKNTLVEVQLQEPDACPQDGVATYPYCIVAVPKLNKPIEFNYSTVKKCNSNIGW